MKAVETWKTHLKKNQNPPGQGKESNRMATHTPAAWARIARESKAEDLWCFYRLTKLSANRLACLNEQGFRCRRESCGQYVEYKAETWRRGSKGSRGHHATEYQCPHHARQFAQDHGLDWPCPSSDEPLEEVKP